MLNASKAFETRTQVQGQPIRTSPERLSVLLVRDVDRAVHQAMCGTIVIKGVWSACGDDESDRPSLSPVVCHTRVVSVAGSGADIGLDVKRMSARGQVEGVRRSALQSQRRIVDVVQRVVRRSIRCRHIKGRDAGIDAPARRRGRFAATFADETQSHAQGRSDDADAPDLIAEGLLHGLPQKTEAGLTA